MKSEHTTKRHCSPIHFVCLSAGLTVAVDELPAYVAFHPGCAIPQMILELLLAPLDRSRDAKSHAWEIILVVALAQNHLCGGQDVRVIRAVDDSVVVRLLRHGVVC